MQRDRDLVLGLRKGLQDEDVPSGPRDMRSSCYLLGLLWTPESGRPGYTARHPAAPVAHMAPDCPRNYNSCIQIPCMRLGLQAWVDLAVSKCPSGAGEGHRNMLVSTVRSGKKQLPRVAFLVAQQ